jgi:hypothetical protein
MNLVYGWCVERVPEDKLEMWLTQLAEPLPGHENAAPTRMQIESEGADFMAAMAAHSARSGG